MLVKKHHRVAVLQLLQDQLAFLFFLLGLGETLGVFQFRNGADLKRHVVCDALSVVIDARNEMFVLCLADEDKDGLHGYSPLVSEASLSQESFFSRVD